MTSESPVAVADEVATEPKRRMPLRWIIVAAAVVLVLLGVAGYFWYQSWSLKKNPQKAAQEESRRLVAAVSELIILPADEEPVVATVVDPEKLQGTPFFAKAQKGDKVLIYNNARKAVLYNPREHRIVEVAPLNIGTPAPDKESR